MLDIHSHILPNVPGSDDGAANFADSCFLLRRASEDGVTGIICTPHESPGIQSDVRTICEQLRPNALDCGIRLYCGMEYRLSHLGWREEPPMTLADTSFLLVELNSGCPSASDISCIVSLLTAGYHLVAVHPERMFSDFRLIRRLAKLGVLFQLTVDAILGVPDKRLARRVLPYLEHGLCHYVASDAHNQDRAYHFRSCRTRIERFFGHEYARILFDVNPARLLENLPPEPVHPPFGSLFRKFVWNIL